MSEDYDWETMGMPTPARLMARVAELMGGEDAWSASVSATTREMKAKWEKDTDMMGRLLRAHLHVEFYLTEYLHLKNPGLGQLDRDKGPTFYFAHKVAMLSKDDAFAKDLLPGIRALNAIRNKFAHELEATITEKDTLPFFNGSFKAMRERKVATSRFPVQSSGIDIVEHFAEYASAMLHGQSAEHTRVFRQALSELSRPPRVRVKHSANSVDRAENRRP